MPAAAAAGWRPWIWSTGLHGAVLLLLAGGVVLTRLEPPTDTALALEAVVVDAATLAALQRASAPAPRVVPRAAPAPPPPQPRPQPQPKPETAPEPARKREAAPAPSPSPKPATAKPAAAKPTTPQPPVPDPVSRPQPAAVDASRAAAEADLRAALAEEDRIAALRASGAAATWSAAIRARIERAWIRPDSARPGIDCTVAVTQTPGGTVLRVEVRACNGDDALRQSIEDAVLRASPLPAPPDPALFERQLVLRFRPDV